jgi:hypothetical protein
MILTIRTTRPLNGRLDVGNDRRHFQNYTRFPTSSCSFELPGDRRTRYVSPRDTTALANG